MEQTYTDIEEVPVIGTVQREEPLVGTVEAVPVLVVSTVSVKVEEMDPLNNMEGQYLDDSSANDEDPVRLTMDTNRSEVSEHNEYPAKYLKVDLEEDLEEGEIRVKKYRRSKDKKKRKVKKKKVPRKKKEKRVTVIKEPKIEKDSRIKVIHISKEQSYVELLASAEDELYVNAAYKCPTCIKGFNFKETYDKHLGTHDESSGNFVCDICKQRMDSDLKLKKHTKSHTLRYQCRDCGYTHMLRSCIEDHYIEKHNEGLDLFHCNHCSRSFMRQDLLRQHLVRLHRRAGEVECPYCHKQYANQKSWRDHCVRSHPAEVKATERLEKNTCQICGLAFPTPSQLRYHCNKHNTTKDFYCVECNKSFKTHSILRNHLRRAAPHVKVTDLPLGCQLCDRRFGSRRNLENHMNRTHLKIKPYPCDLCDKAYINSWGLRAHRRLAHEGYKRPRKYPCVVCDKVFDQNASLKSHMRIHTGERPFQCSSCAAQFRQRSVLSTHIKLVHLKLTRDGRPKTG